MTRDLAVGRHGRDVVITIDTAHGVDITYLAPRDVRSLIALLTKHAEAAQAEYVAQIRRENVG